MKRQNKLSVIIPFLNEEKTLPRTLKKVLARPEVWEVVLVDDGSTDNSAKVIFKYLNRKVRLVKHIKNRGKGAAIRTGVRSVKGDYILIQDADLELDPREYPKILKPLWEENFDFVVGTRWKNSEGSLLFKSGNLLLTTLTNILFGVKIEDLYCGYKAGSKKTWRELKLTSNRFEIEAEIGAKLGKFKKRVKNVEVLYVNPRSYKQGKKIKFKDAYEGLVMILKIRFFNFL